MAKLRIRPSNVKQVIAAGGKVYDLKLKTLSASNKWRKRFWISLVINIITISYLLYITNYK